MALAREDPATLVRTLEVIELEDRAAVKVFSHNLFVTADDEDDDANEHTVSLVAVADVGSGAIKSARSRQLNAQPEADTDRRASGADASDEHSDAQQPPNGTATPSMRDRCFIELEKSIAQQFAVAFKDRTADEEEEHETQSLQEMLRTAKTLIEDLQEVSECVVKCFPPEYEIFEFFDSRYQKWLTTRFVERIGDTDKVAPGDILFTINWIQEYQTKMKELGINVSSSSLLDQYSEDLMRSYLNQIRRTMLEWVGNICKRERTSKPIHDEETGALSSVAESGNQYT